MTLQSTTTTESRLFDSRKSRRECVRFNGLWLSGEDGFEVRWRRSKNGMMAGEVGVRGVESGDLRRRGGSVVVGEGLVSCS